MTDLSMDTDISLLAITVRLGAACLLAFLIGVDREARNQPAGLRTHMLTALAACLFAIISIELIGHYGSLDEGTRLDPIRVVEAVTAGVAFLAAGTIIQARGKVKGLTTGAGMWLAGAIGLACGAGLLTVALLGTAFALMVLIPLRVMESKLFDNKKSGEHKEAD